MLTITDLKPGDSILAWLKIGFALQKSRRVDGTLFYSLPSRADRFDKSDLQQFVGNVVHNDTVNHILMVNASRMTSKTQAVEPPLLAEIHYLAFKRVRLISPHAFAPKAENPLRPTRKGIGTGFYPYRTQTEVMLVW